MSDRQTRSVVEEVVAACQGCPWRNEEGNALGTAARHHDATGHTVHTLITRLVIYGDPHAAPAGQERLPGT